LGTTPAPHCPYLRKTPAPHCPQLRTDGEGFPEGSLVLATEAAAFSNRFPKHLDPLRCQRLKKCGGCWAAADLMYEKLQLQCPVLVWRWLTPHGFCFSSPPRLFSSKILLPCCLPIMAAIAFESHQCSPLLGAQLVYNDGGGRLVGRQRATCGEESNGTVGNTTVGQICSTAAPNVTLATSGDQDVEELVFSGWKACPHVWEPLHNEEDLLLELLLDRRRWR
jgi:hypothetical protein